MQGFKKRWTPTTIRALRGELTREEFARKVGVKALTIYRWELPKEAPESRQPRASSRKKLENAAAAFEEKKQTSQYPKNFLAKQVVSVDENTRYFSQVFKRLMYAQFAQAESLLMDRLALEKRFDEKTHAMTLVCHGFQALLARNDNRSALAAISGLQPYLTTNIIPPLFQLKAYALTALVFSSADGRLFHPERVKRNLQLLRRQAHNNDTDILAFAAIAEARSWFFQGQKATFMRSLELHQNALAEASSPIPRMMGEHLLALASALDGYQPDACRRLITLANEAHDIGFVQVECDALARLSMASHIAGVPRTKILSFTKRFEEVSTYSGRLQGEADLIMFGAKAEVLHGLGRFKEAQIVVDKAEKLSEELQWPASDILMVQTRLAFQMGGKEMVHSMVSSFTSKWSSLGRTSIDACCSYLIALDKSFQGKLAESGQLYYEAYELARATGVRPWLELFSISLSMACYVFLQDKTKVKRTLHALEQALERQPSPWFSMMRSHLLGIARSTQKRDVEARQLLESAVATLELMEEFTERLRVRRALAISLFVMGAPEAQSMMEQTKEEFAQWGLEIGPLQTLKSAQDLARNKKHRDFLPLDSRSKLVVPFKRISVRGMEPNTQLGELISVLEGLCGHTLSLSEIRLDGRLSPIFKEKSNKAPLESFEFGDGCGRRYHLGVFGSLEEEERSTIQLLLTTIALSLEVNALRSLAKPIPTEVTRKDQKLFDVIAVSMPMRKLLDQIQRLGHSLATVLLRGESGSGKEVIAKAIHRLSGRSQKSFLQLNSTAVPESLFESQLFGFKKGAFTGAEKASLGIIRSADGGTLFLDEIGDIPLSIQPKLLRFLENQEVLPLGDTQSYSTDVRIIAATHRDLEQMVEQGTFREDLYYRLQVVPLWVPPLRTRRDDIAPLARHFLQHFTPKGEKTPSLSSDAMIRFLKHKWPGNVRELRNTIQRALAFSPVPQTIHATDIEMASEFRKIKE